MHVPALHLQDLYAKKAIYKDTNPRRDIHSLIEVQLVFYL